jgi:uncharacterized Fe-S center protein
MISTRSIIVAAAFGAFVLGASASANAVEARKELHQKFQDKCKAYSGRLVSFCRKDAASRLSNYSEVSRANYRNCLAEGETREFCDGEREKYWRQKLEEN